MSLPWLEVGFPTLDRPFGIAVWPIFSNVWEMIFGYPAEQFEFVQGVTPMSTFRQTAMALVAYYIIILGGREVMRGREAIQLNWLFKIHNFYLTVISGALLVLFIEQLLPTLVRRGVFYAVCDHAGGWTDKLVVLYYLNYLTKYLELLDTVFLFLKKKPLTFLHTYHHGATALLCYTQLIGHTAVSWVPIVLNLTVHVVMYWYYFQAARGIRIWWKRYITVMQITQFVIDLGFVYFASYTYFASTYFPGMPNMGKCAGEEFAAVAGICILSSYLLLFISFYFATYRKPATKEIKQRGRSISALKEMASEKLPTASQVTASARRFSASAGVGTGFLPSAEKSGSTKRPRKA